MDLTSFPGPSSLTRRLAVLAAFVAAIPATAAGPAALSFPYPAGEELPWKALNPAFMPTPAGQLDSPEAVAACGSGWRINQNYPWGYPNCQGPGPWYSLATVSTGYIDGDEHLDYLVVMSERLILALGLDAYNADGTPSATAKPYCIWAWFDPNATMYKNEWSKDAGVVGDFDGDGTQEVAVVVGPPKQLPGYDQVNLQSWWPTITPNDPRTQKRLMIFGVNAPAQEIGDPNFGNVKLPRIKAWRWLNDQPCDGGVSAGIDLPHGDGHVVKAGQFTDDPGYEIMLHMTENARPKVYSWNGSFGGLQVEFCSGLGTYGLGMTSHSMFTLDMNADGYDEIVLAGVIDIRNGTQWFLSQVPEFQACEPVFSTKNHPDSMMPFDTDGDGKFDKLYVAHDCIDLLLTLDPDNLGAVPSAVYVNDGPTRICELDNEPFIHGQELVAARLFDGPDPNGYDGMHVIVSPKEYGGLYGGSSHSSIVVTPVPNAAGEMDEITYNHNRNINGVKNFHGPGQFGASTIDWDGDRRTDEVLDPWGTDFSIYKLVAGAYDSPACNAATMYAHRWAEIAHHTLSCNDFVPVDVFGDYRDEIVMVTGSSVAILYNSDVNPDPLRHRRPLERGAGGAFADESYLRRLMDHRRRPLDYRGLMSLASIEVLPHTKAASPGQQIAYQAMGRYRNADGNEFVVDLTSQVTWTSGKPSVASFSGSTLTVHGEGYAAVRATLPASGRFNANPALAVGTTSPKPIILYAGWGDSRAEVGVNSTIWITARVADLNGDVNNVRMGGPPGLLLRDTGTFGDKVAGDGVYTWKGPSGVAGQNPNDFYSTIWASDAAANVSNVWPYLTVGGIGPTPPPGYATMPFASEDFGVGPRLRGTGYAATRLQPNVAGLVTLMAEASTDPISGIYYYRNQVLNPSGPVMRDDGMGADQFAGDGLWTGQRTLTLPAGWHLFDFIPFRLTPTIPGDAYPRFRVHDAP